MDKKDEGYWKGYSDGINYFNEKIQGLLKELREVNQRSNDGK